MQSSAIWGSNTDLALNVLPLIIKTCHPFSQGDTCTPLLNF